MEVQPGIHVLTDRIDATTLTVTLIGTATEGMIVDTGLLTTPEAVILPYLAQRGWPTTWLTTIAHTHCHSDHVAGDAALLATSDAPVLIHESEAEYLADPMVFVAMMQATYAEEPGPPPDPDEVQRFYGPGTHATRRLVDGDTVMAGGRPWRVAHTPGHSQGGICLYDPERGILITGDAIQAEGTTSCDLAFYFEADDYERALDAVDALAIDTIIAGHPFKPFATGYLTGADVGRFLAVSRQAHQRYDQQVVEILAAAGRPLATAAVAQQLTALNGFDRVVGSAVSTTRAHLQRLERQGAVTSHPGTGQPQMRSWERR